MESTKYIKMLDIYGECVEADNSDESINNPKTQLPSHPIEPTITTGDEKINEPITFHELKISEKVLHKRIIGKAGIGKSTHISDNYLYHDYLLLSYTRIAASQINGTTISSAFQLGRINDNPVKKCISRMKWFTKHIVEHIQLAKGLVIDEFYTVPGAVMTKVDVICQVLRESKEPFGGMQLILVGDDRQTESIDAAFIDTELYKGLEFNEVMLEEHPQMRLTAEYMKFCDMFRNPKLNRDKMIRLLKNAKFAQEELKDAYSVYYTNKEVNDRNKRGMQTFEGEVVYKRGQLEYRKDCPIRIKSNWGALCNGMMGFIRGKNGRKVIIEVENKMYEIAPSQVDFTPGFATTIHVCQSKTWPGINVYIHKKDIYKDRAKYVRLIYVALTRVRHFDKCYIQVI
jgi:ATP-dependent exoDNAse (exonuclease V) alpha subunit